LLDWKCKYEDPSLQQSSITQAVTQWVQLTYTVPATVVATPYYSVNRNYWWYPETVRFRDAQRVEKLALHGPVRHEKLRIPHRIIPLLHTTHPSFSTAYATI
jgi:hypothetical protein